MSRFIHCCLLAAALVLAIAMPGNAQSVFPMPVPPMPKPVTPFGRRPDLPGQKVVVPSLSAPHPGAQDEPTPGGALSVDQAVRLSLEHNPDILNMAYQLGVAEASLRVAEETFFPTASASLSPSYDSTGGVGGAGFGGLQLSESGSVSINKTLSDFGQTRARVRAAEAGMAGARAALLQKQEDTVLTVRQAYYTAIADAQLAIIDKDSVTDQQKHLFQALAFYHAGTKAKIDVSQAESGVATAQLALVAAENNRDKDYVNLNVAMGLARDSSYQLDDSFIEKVVAEAPRASDASPLPDPVALREEAYRHRPDLLNLETQIEAAEDNLALARMGFNPVLTSNSNVSIFAAGGQVTPGFGVSLSVALPILDAGATKAAILSARSTLDGLKAQQTSLRNTIFQAVQNDLMTLRQASASIKVARVAERTAGETYNLATRRYQAGLGGSLEILDAQVVYSTARSARVTAETQERTAQAQLDHDVGRIDFIHK